MSKCILKTESYIKQVNRWPKEGRVILAQYDEDTVFVYQAYRSSIGHFAVVNGHFGGDFSLSRMTWIKPNFLWMMYRSGWGTKEGQEVILAIQLRRDAFNEILSLAVHSNYERSIYSSNDEWKSKVKDSEVRLQWDPDHDPFGHPVNRRAIQLGIRGAAIKKYARDWIVSINDISDFVREQRYVVESGNIENLELPKEDIYMVDDDVALNIGITNNDVI